MTIQPDSTLLSHATGSFLTVSGDAPPHEVAADLESHRFVVVLDGDAVVSCPAAEAVAAAVPAGPATVRQVPAPPCVVAPGRMTFAEFCDGPSITLLDLNAEAIVLLDDRQGVGGVLPVAAVQRYLGSGAHAPEPIEMGPHGSSEDHLVHGRPALPLARVLCRESGCGLINELSYFDPDRPPYCRNSDDRHPLRTAV